MNRTSSRSNVVNLTLNQYEQSNTSRKSTSIIYFVIPTGLTEDNCSPRLISAKKLYVDLNLHSEWLSERELLKKTPQNNNVYVLDPFSGTAYDYLKEHFAKNNKFMIIGPQCIKYAAVQQKDLQSPIQSKGYPFCSLAMQNICITLTGFSKEVTAELIDLVLKMNGVVSKAYSSATTHVVAENTLTAKCTEAYKKDIPVMTCTWIKTVWTECQDELIDATDAKFMKYNCPLFHNIKICISQVSFNIKTELERTIITNGGTYLEELTKGETDILVTPFASGQKYKFAQEWKVPCVTPEWIDESIRAGHVSPFDKFHPHQQSPTTTEHLCLTSMENKERIPVPHFSSNTAFLTMNKGLDNPSKFKPVDATSYLTGVSSVTDSALDFLGKAPAGFLHGCTIYLCGQDSGAEKIDVIQKILHSSGATCSDKISERVSHIMVTHSRISQQEVNMIEVLDNVPSIVSFFWLLQSAKQRSPADEKQFAVEIPSLKKNSSEIAVATKSQQTCDFETMTPLVDKTGVLPLRQEKIGQLAARLDFESDMETTPLKHPVKALKDSIMGRGASFSTEKSPRTRRRTSLDPSDRLKKALAFASEGTPETVPLKRKPLIQKDGKSLVDDIEEKAKRRKERLMGSTSNIGDPVEKVDGDHNKDGGMSTAIQPKVLHDDASHSSHQESIQEDTKTEAHQTTSTTTTTTTTAAAADVNDQSSTNDKISTDDESTKKSAAAISKIPNRTSSPPPPRTRRMASQAARSKFGVLRDLNMRERRQKLGDLVFDWTDKMRASAEGIVISEMIRDELQEPSSHITNDDETEIVPKNSLPHPEKSQTTKESQQQRSDDSPPTRKLAEVKTSEKQEDKESSKPSYLFILSGCDGVEKTAAKGIIEELGGGVSDLDIYDKTADAVIGYKLIRNEKILGGIAGGLPILHPKYLTFCQDTKIFLEFVNFIWTEEDCTSLSEKKLAQVAQSWYQKIRTDPCSMPFSKFRAYLSEPFVDGKREAFQRLIEAGGGKVFTSLDGINIVIGDLKQAVGQAAQANVAARTSNFLNEVIFNNGDVSWMK